MNSYTNPEEEFDPDKYHSRRDINDMDDDRPRFAYYEEESKPKKKRQKKEAPKRREAPLEPSGPTSFERLVDFFHKTSTRIVLGALLLFVAVILIGSFISYFTSGAADQSRVDTMTIGQMAQNAGEISNIAGPAGAKAAHTLVGRGLGLGSIVLIAYLVIVALSLFGLRKIKFWQLTFKSLILAVTVSFIFGLFSLDSSSVIPLGGYHGRYMNLWIISRLGWLGAVAVSCLLLVIVVTLYLTQLVSFYEAVKEKKRIIDAKRVHQHDKEEYSRARLKEELSDGPISAPVSKKDSDRDATKDDDSAFKPRQFDFGVRDNFVPAQSDAEDEENGRHDERELSVDNAPVMAEDNAAADETVATDPVFVVENKEIEQAEDDVPVEHDIQGPYDPKAELSRFKMPPIDLLTERPRKASVDLAEQEENKERIIKTLNHYGIQIQQIKATVGPTVTLYEIIPAEGIRIAKIKNLEDDIALSLSALGIRIIAPIPGKGTVGIEVPNQEPQVVSIRSILGSKAFRETKYRLPIALGAKIDNEVYIADLAKMPHLLVAGATGMGKSVGLNTIIASLLYKLHPAELKFVLIDPKKVEFSLFNRLEKHYLAKLPDEEDAVVTDPLKVINTLKSLCQEMDDRYALLKEADVRSISEYNEKFINRRLNPEKGHRFMPYFVIIIDEFADLIMTASKEIETPIARIAQMARAVGMHMIIATQRPSTNVITGMIKANFPARMAFRVMQMIDSRTILDAPGANQLSGMGDMLIHTNNVTERVQCALITTQEVTDLCNFINDQMGYSSAYPLPEFVSGESDGAISGGNPAGGARDPLFEEVARWIVNDSTASTSSLQRRYSIGFNRAGKIMDQLEAAGIVGPAQGGKPRQVLVDVLTIDSYLNK